LVIRLKLITRPSTRPMSAAPIQTAMDAELGTIAQASAPARPVTPSRATVRTTTSSMVIRSVVPYATGD